MENTFLFKNWKIWLLKEVKKSIASHNRISLKNGFPNQFIEINFEEIRMNKRNQERFLKRFAALAVRHGFNPLKKSSFSSKIENTVAMHIRQFYLLQKQLIRDRSKEMETLVKMFAERRARLPVPICVILIFALESNKGKIETLERIRNYLSGGRFEQDIGLTVRELKREIRVERKFRKSLRNVTVSSVPKAVLGLTANRSGKNVNSWRAVWVNDLYRTVSSADHSKILKSVSKTKKASQKREILNIGIEMMNKV